MYNKVLLGKRIKELRKNKGFTQELLSEKVGIDPKHLSRIECGVNSPSLDLLNKISKVLNVDTCLLFEINHLRDKNTLIKEINEILNSESEENVRTFYKVLISIIS